MTRNKKIILGVGLIVGLTILIGISSRLHLIQKEEKTFELERCIEWCWKNRAEMINSCIDSCKLAPHFYRQFLPPGQAYWEF